MPDLIAGYASFDGGTLSIRRGRREARETDFEELVNTYGLRLAPDFLATGDFDADGHLDIVAAERGARFLNWMPGDGRGGFAPLRRVDLPGEVTAFASGEIDRIDGLVDLVIAVRNDHESKVLVFEGPAGALQREPWLIASSVTVSALALGRLDGDIFADLVVGAGRELLIIRGRDRKLSLDAAARATVTPAAAAVRSLPTEISALAIGDFDGDNLADLAALGIDGAVMTLKAPTETARAAGVDASRQIHRFSTTIAPQLGVARASSLALDHLLIVDRSARQLHLLTAETERRESLITVPSIVSFDVEGEPITALPLRLNGDALSDLVVLTSASASPVVVLSAPANTFTVTADFASGPGTLTAAIQAANASPGPDLIAFNLPGPSPHLLQPTGTLPDITEAVTIDGATQPGFTGPPVVELPARLIITGGNTTVRHLLINRLTGPNGQAIILRNGSDNIVESNYLGADARGECNQVGSECPLANGIGVLIDNSSNNIIGGTTPAAGNLIASSRVVGVSITGAASTGNRIVGNLMGADITGTKRTGNRSGVSIASRNNMVGGIEPGARNVIVLGFSWGIAINGNGDGNLVQGNYLGLDPSGTIAHGNRGELIIDASSNNTIGGTTPAARNIFACSDVGVLILSDATGNLVQGNYFGLGPDGDARIGDRDITIYGEDNTIGGAVTGARNVIRPGVVVWGDRIRIQGNYLGTDATGTQARGTFGITINRDAEGTLIGGVESGAGNLISGNPGVGVYNDARGTRILGNYIGTQADGVSPLGNGGGVSVRLPPDTVVQSPADMCLVGGVEEGAGNIIAYNRDYGVAITSGAVGVQIRGNSIFGNLGPGIDIGANGPTPNDPNQGPDRPQLQNAPLLLLATTAAGGLTVRGRLESYPDAQFIVDSYADDLCDPSGFGQGRRYLGSATITTDASGRASFSFNLSVSVSSRTVITATATRVLGNTSEFSSCQQAVDTCYGVVFENGRNGQLITSYGTSGQIQVGALNGCLWTASSNANWLRLTSGTSGSGDGAIEFEADQNIEAPMRAATVSIGAQQISVRQMGRAANVSAASYRGEQMATRSIIAAFGSGLATGTVAAGSVPLPTVLGGTRVRIKPSVGDAVEASLFFASPEQVNYLLDTPYTGEAVVTITSGDGMVSEQRIQIVGRLPGVFTANADGAGVPAGYLVRVVADGTQAIEPVAQFDAAAGRHVPAAIDLGPEGEQVFIVLFCTGNNELFALGTQIVVDGVVEPVSFQGPHPTFIGVYQVNARLPRVLAGRGEVGLVLRVNGVESNTVRIRVN